ncbi:hypothetical protein DV737_g5139, partial [Chaetothyriales sp. CBS 132003]
MRIRFPFLTLPSTPNSVRPYVPQQSDKALHFVAFFALTATFYFILDTARRRVLHLTLIVCTLVLSVGSEIAQGLLPNDRDFDPWDVLANVLGSLAALGLASWYHKRAAERRRRAKFSALVQDDGGEGDVELGEGPGLGQTTHALGRAAQEPQETGTVAVPPKTVEDELDNWDENVPDEVWDDEDDEATGKEVKLTPPTSSAGSEEAPPVATAAAATVPTTQVDKISVD